MWGGFPHLSVLLETDIFLHTYFWEEVETSPAVFLPTKPGDFITNDFITNVLYTPISSRVDDLFQNLTIVCAEI